MFSQLAQHAPLVQLVSVLIFTYPTEGEVFHRLRIGIDSFSPSRRIVVCRAQQNKAAKAVTVSLPALLAAHPAFALVDDRLAGEGTGKIFGINDPALFWALAGAFALVWSLYYISGKDLGGDKGEDSGLSL